MTEYSITNKYYTGLYKDHWTDYWAAIEERLHEESGLHYPNNKMAQILREYLNGILNTFSDDNKEFLDQGFLITTDGFFLDIRGDEMGIPRKEGDYATGTITFMLTKEVPQGTEPEKIENETVEGIVFNYVPETLQSMLDELNEEREANGENKLQLRKCTAPFTIPIGTVLTSDTGFEYILDEAVEFPVGESQVSAKIVAKDSGKRYNTAEKTINTMDYLSINKDLRCTNPIEIRNGVDGESDEDYRRRLLNNINTNISVNYLKRQNIIIYSKKNLNDDIRIKMTSFNPYLNNKYCTIPPDWDVSDFLNYELIANDNIIVYIKGW